MGEGSTIAKAPLKLVGSTGAVVGNGKGILPASPKWRHAEVCLGFADYSDGLFDGIGAAGIGGIKGYRIGSRGIVGDGGGRPRCRGPAIAEIPAVTVTFGEYFTGSVGEADSMRGAACVSIYCITRSGSGVDADVEGIGGESALVSGGQDDPIRCCIAVREGMCGTGCVTCSVGRFCIRVVEVPKKGHLITGRSIPEIHGEGLTAIGSIDRKTGFGFLDDGKPVFTGVDTATVAIDEQDIVLTKFAVFLLDGSFGGNPS